MPTRDSTGAGQRAPAAVGRRVAQPRREHQHRKENRSYLMLTHWLIKQKAWKAAAIETHTWTQTWILIRFRNFQSSWERFCCPYTSVGIKCWHCTAQNSPDSCTESCWGRFLEVIFDYGFAQSFVMMCHCKKIRYWKKNNENADCKETKEQSLNKGHKRVGVGGCRWSFEYLHHLHVVIWLNSLTNLLNNKQFVILVVGLEKISIYRV